MCSKNILLLAVVVTLSGCAGVNLHYEPVAGTNIGHRTPVLLSVTDQRKIVSSGEKTPSYLGRFGDLIVHTDDNAPLAGHLKQDLLQELRSLGFDELAAMDSRPITVTIQDWNTDGNYFWYEVTISVTSPEGNVLAQSVVKDRKALNGGVVGITAGMPETYGEIIKALVRDNEEVYAALKTGMVSRKAEKPQDTEKAALAAETQSPPARKEIEQYAGIFGGNAQVANAQVTATSNPCGIIFPCPATASQNLQFDKGNIGGFAGECGGKTSALRWNLAKRMHMQTE